MAGILNFGWISTGMPRPVVTDGTRAVGMDGDHRFSSNTREVFVDGVVEHLEDAVVQAALVVGPIYMPGRCRTTRKPFELVDFRCVVKLIASDVSGDVRFFGRGGRVHVRFCHR